MTKARKPRKCAGYPMLPGVVGSKEEALDLFEQYRPRLLVQARKVADDLFVKYGSVTSTQVLFVLRSDPEWCKVVAKVDPRFMGAVFRSGWTRIGYKAIGSHKRPVSVWTRNN